jgi:hypothetical protein
MSWAYLNTGIDRSSRGILLRTLGTWSYGKKKEKPVWYGAARLSRGLVFGAPSMDGFWVGRTGRLGFGFGLFLSSIRYVFSCSLATLAIVFMCQIQRLL